MKHFVKLLSVFLSLCVLSLGSTYNATESAFTFKKIFFVLLENQPIRIALNDPFMSALAKNGTLFTHLNAIVNPSQPNYVALVAGSRMGVTNDDLCNLQGKMLVDIMEEKHISWKAYQEDFPSECFAGDRGLYMRKHNPFILFDQVRNNRTLCSKIVNSAQLAQDIKQNTVPQYSFYTPNMKNNGHDTGMRYGANWLQSFITPLLKEPNFMRDMLLVVTFDEGIAGENTIYTLFLGADAPAGYVDPSPYTLYSLLRLVEDQFGLSTLGRNDQNANVIKRSNFVQGPTTASRSTPTSLPSEPTSGDTAEPTPASEVSHVTSPPNIPKDIDNNTTTSATSQGHTSVGRAGAYIGLAVAVATTVALLAL